MIGSRRAGAREDALATLAWPAAYLAVAGLLQASIPVPWDEDTAYHVAVGRLLRTHGILHAFPWTPFSWLAEHYADKELGFHLLYALWFTLPRQPPADAATVIREKFGARYVLCRWDDRFRAFFAQLAAAPGVAPIPASPHWAAYDLGG